MKLIVGLGNPGRKYRSTRHNVGFDVAAELARRYGTGSIRSRFQAEVIEANFPVDRGLILCPNTYMNRSGSAVRAAFDFYKASLDDVLIVCDDLNLSVGRIRIRSRGSAGGQKGLQDIIRCLGSEEFVRLRVGIDRPPAGWDAVDYVLGKFSPEQRTTIDQMILTAADAVADWLRFGVQHCMNQYNGMPADGGSK